MLAQKGRPAPGRALANDQDDEDDEDDEDTDPMPRRAEHAPPLGSTTIRVSTATKAWLDRARLDRKASSFDALLGELRRQLEQPTFPGFDAESLVAAMGEGPEIAAAGVRVGHIAAFAMEDPETALFFNWSRRPHGTAKRLPAPGDDGFVRDAGFLEPVTEAGAWVQAPSGCYLTERDDTLPEDVVERIRAEAKERKRAKKKQ